MLLLLSHDSQLIVSNLFVQLFSLNFQFFDLYLILCLLLLTVFDMLLDGFLLTFSECIDLLEMLVLDHLHGPVIKLIPCV